jgi:hypothetical protein
MLVGQRQNPLHMKRNVLIALASLFMLGSAGLRAAEGDASSKQPAPATEKRKASDEKLTPEEREKRRKEAIEKRDKRVKELRAKKDAGTLTETEKRQLERLEKQGDRAKRAKDDNGRPEKRSKNPRAKDPVE